MINLDTYLLFIAAVAVLVIVPGPDMVYMLARTVVQGRKAGMIAAFGINAGAYVHVVASIIGLTAILASSSIAFTVIKLVGACYLVWIGVQAIISQSGTLNIDDKETKNLNGKTIFWQGFLSDVLNPKVSIFFLAFLPQFIDVHHQTLSVTQQLVILGVTGNIIAICINLVIVYFAGTATSSLRKNKKLVNWLNKAIGIVFIGLGIRLAREKL